MTITNDPPYISLVVDLGESLSSPELSNIVANQVATEFKLRCVLSVKYTLDFKILIGEKNVKGKSLFYSPHF